MTSGPLPHPLNMAEDAAWNAHYNTGTQETYDAYVAAITAKRMAGLTSDVMYRHYLKWSEELIRAPA